MTSIKIAPPGAPAYPNWLRVLLLIVTIGKIVSSLTDLAVLFDNDKIFSWGGGLVIAATIALSPFLAVAAFVYVLRHRFAEAIIAIAGLALLDGLSYVPSIVNFWSEFPDPGYAGIVEIVQMVVAPIVAVVAMILAWRGNRLRLATTLALVPTLIYISGVVAFGIAFAIYGF
jgi:hypothetical protein